MEDTTDPAEEGEQIAAEEIVGRSASLFQLADTHVRPVVYGQINKTDHEGAVAATFYRMMLLLEAAVALRDR